MTCLHNHDQILEFLRKIFLKGFQIYQNYLCALNYNKDQAKPKVKDKVLSFANLQQQKTKKNWQNPILPHLGLAS